MTRRWVQSLIWTSIVSVCMCAKPSPPVVIDNTDAAVIVKEDTPIGTVLWTLKMLDGNGDDVIITYPEYETESKTLVTIVQTQSTGGLASADIVLNKTLDRDFNPDRRQLHFLVEDQSDNHFQTTVVVDLLITDVNDERPAFQNLPYRLEIQEDNESGSVVFTDIYAMDPDSGIGGKVAYSMEPITQSSQDAVRFMATFSINNKTGDITQTMELDHEAIQFYQFTVHAVDGYGLNSSEVLTIRVLDIQDTPPVIQGGLPFVVTIPENMPMGTHFYTARAMDGDRGIPNDVQFEFISGTCVSLFAVDTMSGEVTVQAEIDRDDGAIMDSGGVCELELLVSEVHDSEWDQFGPTTTTTTLSIFVTDENDNSPAINRPHFTAYIDDTAQLNYPLQFENETEILIEDKDQGSSGILELVLRDEDGDITYDFEPLPSVIASRGRPIIALKSPYLLKRRDRLTLKLYAIERDTSERRSASTVIEITVMPAATTAQPTTAVITTPRPDVRLYIASLAGAIIPLLLLIWAAAATCYYCLKRRGVPKNNKVFHHALVNANGNNVNSDASTKPERGFNDHISSNA